MPPNERVESVRGDYEGKAQKFWSNYVSEAAQHDKHLTENWKGNMDSALIFAGLFSAVVSAFIIESYKLLKEDPNDMTNVLLTQILAVQMATLSSNNSSIPLIPTATPPMKFVLSPTAITVNILWFLSLVCSLAAAFLMILIQQWIRDYLQRIERNSDPLRRARNRIFLSNGMEGWRMDVVVHYVPTLLHISLFLFFSGLYVFLAPINRTVTLTVIPIFLCCAALYGLVTVAPIINLSSPYETSFSSLFWRVFQYIRQVLRGGGSRSLYLQGARNQLALSSYETDAGAFVWLYNQISNENELHIFIGSLPEFLNSSDGHHILSLVINNERNHATFGRLLGKIIFLANLHEDSTQSQRAVACVAAISPILRAIRPEPLRKLLFFCPHLLAISNNATLPMICLRVLTMRHSYLYRHILTVDPLLGFARQTYVSSINAINDMRQVLEDVVTSHEGDCQTLEDIGDLVKIYCATLESKSAELHRWSEGFNDSMEYSYIKFEQLSSIHRWFRELHLNWGLSFSCDIPTVVPGADWDKVLHGPYLLAFMRATGALECIPESSLTSPRQTSPEPAITSNGDLQLHFLREIHPLLRLLDIVGAKYQIGVPRELSKYGEVLQLILRTFGPLGTARFINDDRFKGSRVVKLLEFIIHLKQRPDLISGSQAQNDFHQTVDRLGIISGGPCAEHFFMGVLYALLTLEREAVSNGKSFAFPKSGMKYLISFIQDFQDSDALQMANRLFPATLTTSEMSVMQGNHPVSLIPSDLQQTCGQWKALHDRIVEERSSVLSKTERYRQAE